MQSTCAWGVYITPQGLVALRKIHACAIIRVRCKTRRQPAGHKNECKMHIKPKYHTLREALHEGI